MSERHLATVRSVSAIVTLFDKEGNPAQSVEGVFLDGWFSIVQRGDFKVGDNVLYLEIDSVLNPELAWVQTYAPFMEKHHWRLKTLKLNSLRLPDENGAPSPYPPISQGLVLPMQVITDAQAEKNDAESLDALLGIEKYERPVKAMSGDARGSFPVISIKPMRSASRISPNRLASSWANRGWRLIRWTAAAPRSGWGMRANSASPVGRWNFTMTRPTISAKRP